MNKLDKFNEIRIDWSTNLASALVDEFYNYSDDIYVEVDDEISYNEEAQDKFNDFVDAIETVMIGFAKELMENKIGLETLKDN